MRDEESLIDRAPRRARDTDNRAIVGNLHQHTIAHRNTRTGRLLEHELQGNIDMLRRDLVRHEHAIVSLR